MAGTNSDKLRDEIDRGAGGDKVNWPDPAAAPLGVDDEAAGTPPTAERLRMARADLDRRRADPSGDRSERSIPDAQGRTRSLWRPLAVALAAAVVGAVLVMLFG